jgi:hypothetical protein|tara:strand:- start:277 stop:450 length:174 start_codon:yes stop_codon:yes gene_type:complete
MVEHTVTEATHPSPPAPPEDAENPAIIDLQQTFKWFVITFVGFAACAAFIILRTRMG